MKTKTKDWKLEDTFRVFDDDTAKSVAVKMAIHSEVKEFLQRLKDIFGDFCNWKGAGIRFEIDKLAGKSLVESKEVEK